VTPTIIGLTGTVGAGKSLALRILGDLGAATISSDEVVHKLLATEELRDALVARWGEGVATGGGLDRSRVAEIVFRDQDELAWLESQLHPRVGGRIAEWRSALAPGARLGVVEVPLLFESGMEDLFDAVLCVTASRERRERRAAERGLGELEGRGGRQLSEQEKVARSDFVVANEGTPAELEAKLEGLLPELEASGAR
jgi:dephospho-CoA kinase